MRALIYTRQSTDTQDTTQASQANDCMRWAETNGYEVVGFYHDEISGAVPVTKRSGFSALLADMKDGDTIISKRRDRLGRDLIDNAKAETLINERGGRFVTTTGADSSTPIGMVSNQIEDVFAGYERALIKQRTRDALAELRRQGKPAGTPLLGSKIVYTITVNGDEVIKIGKLAEDLDEKAKIEIVRSWRAEGLTYEQLRQRCDDNGITSRRGSTPSHRTLHTWCAGIDKPKVKRVNKEGPVPARRMEARQENKGLAALIKAYKAQGMSLRAIAAKVTSDGFTTSKGGPITKTQVTRILANG